MAEIENYTLNFSFGRPLYGLNFAEAKLACTEIERAPQTFTGVAYG